MPPQSGSRVCRICKSEVLPCFPPAVLQLPLDALHQQALLCLCLSGSTLRQDFLYFPPFLLPTDGLVPVQTAQLADLHELLVEGFLFLELLFRCSLHFARQFLSFRGLFALQSLRTYFLSKDPSFQSHAFHVSDLFAFGAP